MGATVESLLTWAGNGAGYLLAAFVVVHSARRTRRKAEAWGFGDAGVALVMLWLLILGWYVAIHAWVDSYPHADEPSWMTASEGAAENIQSEVWQVWLASLVFKWAKWPGSPESK